MKQSIRNSSLFRTEPFLLGLLGWGALLAGIASAAAPYESGEFQVTEDQGRISVRANEAPVSELVKAIGEKAGIEVIVVGDVDQLTTIELRNATATAAIEAVASNVVMVSKPDGQVSRVYVLPEGQEGRLPAGVAAPSTSSDATEPFKFTFDPTEAATETTNGD